MKKTLLKLVSLEVAVETKIILKKLNLDVKENEIHVIMGPNGSGKSTFSKIIAGHPLYKVQSGLIEFCGKNLLAISPEERSHWGLFLGFQYPLEIAGVTNYDFLRIAYNEKQKYLKREELDPIAFMKCVNSSLKKLEMDPEFLNRNLNEGFSGGEKKRNEILQLLLLEPKLIILDEIDSGLDVDAIKIICKCINENVAKGASLIIITHYPRILNYLKPNYVHIMLDGKIIKTGNLELVDRIEKYGYQGLF